MDKISSRFANLSPLKQALLAVEELQARLEKAEAFRTEPIAIIGLGCRFPGAANPAEFWHLLENGEDAVREVPPSRWKIDDYYDPDPDAPGKMSTRWGGFLDQIDQFDADFFGISPREAAAMDPQQRLLLEVAWEALEDAGQGRRELAARLTGVFIGITGDEYAQLFHNKRDLAVFNAYFASGIARSVAAGRISYILGLQGPNLSIDTACSSSLVAVHTACLNLRMGECGMALAGGVNVILSPEIGIAFSKAHMMAADGRSKTFDSRADGFVRAEGCGMVVLKRLSDARADGDRIVALIRGSSVNQDGRSSGLTAPSRRAQEAVMRQALAQGNVQPHEIGYVETHGTGTELGDPIEAQSLAAVLGPGRGADNPLVAGSVKTNIGHLESAAGIAGLIKTVLALQHEKIPRHLHFRELNPHIDWGGVPVVIPLETRPWPRGERKRLAGVSAFGFSGTNAHLVLEEAPVEAAPAQEFERPRHILAVSARSPEALDHLIHAYARQAGDWADLCFTANAGRSHFEYRMAVTAAAPAELREKLLTVFRAERIRDRDGIRPVFLFSGQGAQYAGMGLQLYQTQPVFRSALDDCAALLGGELERPLVDVLWGGATELLTQTAYTQPALFAIEYAVAELWKSWGIEPAAVLGHSVGEYVAACVAGIYPLSDGIRLIAARGRLMQNVAGRGAMTAVRASEDDVLRALRGLESRVALAAVNAPQSMVISGYEQELKIAESRLGSAGFRVQPLTVSHAFHSPQMQGMLDEFKIAAGRMHFAAPRLPLISGVTGRAAGRDELSDPEYWGRQVIQPVRFGDAIETLRARNFRVFIEVGPGTTLCALGAQCFGESEALWAASLKPGRGDWEQILDSLARLYVRGADVDWSGFDRPYARKRMGLPTYPFERRRCWIEESARPVPVPSPPGNPSEPEPVRLELEWEARKLETTSGPVGGDWLIAADRGGSGAALSQDLEARGARCTLLGAHERIGPAIASRAWHGVVYLRALDADPGAPIEAQRGICGDALELVQALAKQTGETAPRVWLVTRGTQMADQRQDRVAAAQSTLWGMAQAVAAEHPEWGIVCIDLDPAGGAANLIDEICSGDGEEQVACRGGERLVARLSAQPFGPPSSDAAPISAGATYLITGAFGGLGMSVAEWLIESGARSLALIGRRTPSTLPPALRAAVERGVRIATFAADVSRREELQQALSRIAADLPPLAGIFHLAAALDDGVLVHQTWERFERVLGPKAGGAWNLHELTAALPLDFFILFSSPTSLLGAAGQGNYAAANAFLDALAHERRRRGLPAVSIGWGAWAAGMAMREGLARRRQGTGLIPMSVERGLDLLRQIMLDSAPQVGAGCFDFDRLLRRDASGNVARRFCRLRADGARAQAPAEAEWLDRWHAAAPAGRASLLRECIQGLALRVLGFPADRAMDPQQPLGEMGLDSLMAVELRNALAVAVGQTLPATLLFSYPTLDDLTNFLSMRLQNGAGAAPTPKAAGKMDALDRIEELSDEEVEQILSGKRGT